MAGFGASAPDGGVWAEDLGADAVPILDARFEYVAAERMGAWLLQAFLDRLRERVYADELAAAPARRRPLRVSSTSRPAARSRSGAFA